MTAARLALALAAASALLIAGARAGGARGEAGESRRARSPGYPAAAAEVVVADSLRVAGEPMELSLFQTADPPSQVVRFYADAFHARGLLPVLTAGQPAHVAAFDPDTRRQRFVTALPLAGGRTLVLIGAIERRQTMSSFDAPQAPSVPVPPGQRGYFGFRSDDAGARAESASFVTALSVPGVAAFYRRTLADQGYVERGDSGAGLLRFARRGAFLSVALQALDAAGGAAVFVNQVEGGPG